MNAMRIACDAKKKSDFEYYLAVLSKELSQTSDGSISFGTGGKYETIIACIHKLFRRQFEKMHHFDEIEILYILGKASYQCVRNADFSVDNFLAVFDAESAKYKAIVQTEYVFYSTISIDADSPKYSFNTIRYKDAHFTFSYNSPKSFDFPRIPSRKKYSDIFPKDFQHLRVHIRARNNRKAFDQALLLVDEIRALWNLWQNYGMKRFYTGTKMPYNHIVLGPYATLHEANGHSISMRFYENENWNKITRAFKIPKIDYNRMKKVEIMHRRQLKKNPFHNYIESALVLYNRALDLSEPMATMSKLWAVLEKLTVKKPDENYDKVIRRATFHFKDRKYHKCQLNLLRDARNRLVHDGDNEETQYGLHYVRELKMYVENLLTFHLNIGDKFNDLDEIGWYLELPVDKQTLKRRIKYMETAHKMFSK